MVEFMQWSTDLSLYFICFNTDSRQKLEARCIAEQIGNWPSLLSGLYLSASRLVRRSCEEMRCPDGRLPACNRVTQSWLANLSDVTSITTTVQLAAAAGTGWYNYYTPGFAAVYSVATRTSISHIDPGDAQRKSRPVSRNPPRRIRHRNYYDVM